MDTFFGATRYEFLMQARRKALWIGLALAFALVSFVTHAVITGRTHPSMHDATSFWTSSLSFILAAGAGLLLANRTPRDRSTRVAEVLGTTPAPQGARFVGKYLGSVTATAIPVLLIDALGLGYIAAYYQDASAIPLGLAMFVAVVIPALLFVGAFALAFTTFLWAPLYQFLFVGYWIWSMTNPDDFPLFTPNGTLVSASGAYALKGFFGYSLPSMGLSHTTVTPGLALLNIAVILGCAALGMLAGWRILVWQGRRG